MNQRNSPRLLPGPTTTIVTLRKRNSAETLSGSLLDQSDEGVAIQLGRRCQVNADECVELLVGDTWESAIVTSTKRQGISHRVGLRRVAASNTASAVQELTR